MEVYLIIMSIKNLVFLFFSLISSIILGIVLLISNFFSLFDINFVYLTIGISFFILIYSQVIIDFKNVSIYLKIISILMIIISSFSSFFGYNNEIKIKGKNTFIFSNERKIYNLVIELKNEAIIIQENQSLLSYPKEQLATMKNILLDASKQAEVISKKRNPVLSENLPKDEFYDLYKEINAVSDLQRKNLILYIEFLDEESDQKYNSIVANNNLIISMLFEFAKNLAEFAKDNNIRIELNDNEK
jgi:hypothetical protein